MCKTNYKMNNTRLVNMLIGVGTGANNVMIDGRRMKIKTGEDSVGNITGIAVTLAPHPDPDIDVGGLKINRKLSGYDWAVHDAVCTLYLDKRVNGVNGDVDITYLEIYRVVSGDDSAHPAVGNINKIKESVQRLRHVDIAIDYSKENENVRNYFAAGSKMKYAESILVCGCYECKHRNDTKSDGISIIKTPMLLDYAMAWGNGKAQLITIPYDLLAIPMRLTDKTVAIRNYLLRYAASRKKKRLHNDVIKYETIMNNCGLGVSEHPQQKKREIEIINNILDHLLAEKYITSWDYNNHNSSYVIKI